MVYQKKISRIKQYKYKNKNQLNFINQNNVCNRLYEDAKYKQSYLSALKLLYQLKEYKDCPFQPKINKGNYYFYNDNSFLLNNKINKFNRQRRNCMTNEFEKSNSSININYLNKIFYYHFYLYIYLILIKEIFESLLMHYKMMNSLN